MRGSEGRREKQKEDRKRGELCQKHRWMCLCLSKMPEFIK
jgi:hypothetical protein